MEFIKRIEEIFLSIFPGYRELKMDWEKTNRELDTEIANKNNYKRQKEQAEDDRNELIKRCYDAIVLVEETKLKQSTKNKIIDKLRGLV